MRILQTLNYYYYYYYRIKNEKVRVTLCEKAAGALYIVKLNFGK